MAASVNPSHKVATSLPILPQHRVRVSDHPGSYSLPTRNSYNVDLQLPTSSPAWLKGGGPIQAPTRNSEKHSHQNRNGNTTLPAVARVRSQTYNGDDAATRRIVRSNPMPGIQNGNHLKVPHRKSNSAPSPVAGRKQITNRPTNHDRKESQSRPALPKINNLVAAGGVSTQSQSKHVLAGSSKSSKRWATSWADARAHQPSLKSKEYSDNNGTRSSPRSSLDSSSQRSTPRTENGHKNPKLSSSKTTSSKNSTSSDQSSPTSPQKGSQSGKLPHMHSAVSSTNSDSKSSHGSKTEMLDESKKQERQSISNMKPKYYGATDKFIDSPITNAYKTNFVHANTLRTGTFVDYEDVGQTTNSKKSKNPAKTRDRSGSQASLASNASSTLRRGVAYRPTPKCKRPVVITKKSRKQERSLNSVYDNKTYKVQRKAWILKKMETMEKLNVEEYNKNLEEREKKLQESTLKQRQALKKVRDGFDADQVKRFKRQYVSWKSVETERLHGTREIYGLPDNIYDDRYDRTLKDVASEKKVKGKKKTFQQYASWVRNIKRFENMLNPSLLGNPESLKSQMPAIVEGIDTVQLSNPVADTGTGTGPKSPKKTVRVRNVIGSAKRLLSANDDLDATSINSFLRVDNTEDLGRISAISGLTDLDDDDDDGDLSLSDDDLSDFRQVVKDRF